MANHEKPPGSSEVTAEQFALKSSSPEQPLGTLVSEGSPLGSSSPTIPAPALDTIVKSGVVVGERYELVRVIAEGGMGKVFYARHLELRMPVAVKVMHPHIARSAEHVERFRREALAASRLGDPHIVKVLDFGKLDETFYIVMEYIDGQGLGHWLDTFPGPPAMAEILPILVQTLDALTTAHDAGIVHRDLKPDNILLVNQASGPPLVKIVDFGLARFRDPAANDLTITQPDAVAGTPGYMSPEQCRSLKVTHSTDLYAFGCILTELLQLEPPFVGESVMDVISKHMFAPIPPLRRPDAAEPVPVRLERLRRDLLAKVATQRPANAKIVRQRLLAAFSEEGDDARSAPAVGTREQRIPEWNQASESPQRTDTSTHSLVHCLRLGVGEPAIDPLCLVGLSSLGFSVRQCSDVGAIAPGGLVLLDTGEDFVLAIRTVEELRRRDPQSRIAVGLGALTTQIINALIEAGADDVVRAPTSSDLLGRKLARLERRGAPLRPT